MAEEPKVYQAIMVSSTFKDLEGHRREVIEAINHFGFRANVMEYSGARADADVIDASLRMVRESAAYIGVIGHKYGQTPRDSRRNPKRLSITELEFNEARKLKKPILLFLMSDDHPVKKADVERDAGKQAKLEAFRAQAKRSSPRSKVERIYETFDSEEQFAKKAAIGVGRLAELLKSGAPSHPPPHDPGTHDKLEAILAAVGKLEIPDRAVREAIARFIDVKPEASQAEVVQAVERFEAGYRGLEQQLAAITVTDNRVTSLKADAEAALAEGDLDKARAAWRDAANAARDKAVEPVRTAAELKSAEAGAHLLALDWEAADAAWAEATAMLAGFDASGAEELAEDASSRLRIFGELYARAGALNAAIDRLRTLSASAKARGDECEAARLRNNLGLALQIQGERIGDPKGLHLLDEAVAAYRAALIVRTRADMPAEWAMTQNNLGNALLTQGQRTGGTDSFRRLDEAVAAYRAALTVHTRADMPREWAVTQNNLGVALANQGRHKSGSEGLCLLDQATTAYRDALTVRTRADVPAEWAMTQNNLGAALHTRGERTGGPDGLRLLEEAVAAYRDALGVYTRTDTPADWAIAQENIALAFESMADIESDRARAHLLAAETALSAALSVYTPEHMAYYHEKATESLAEVRAKLAALDD